jgi:hypothetical protein
LETARITPESACISLVVIVNNSLAVCMYR